MLLFVQHIRQPLLQFDQIVFKYRTKGAVFGQTLLIALQLLVIVDIVKYDNLDYSVVQDSASDIARLLQCDNGKKRHRMTYRVFHYKA